MPSDVCLLLPLVGGFWFVYRTHFLRLTAEQLKQPIVVLLAAFFGVWFGLLGRLITSLGDAVPFFHTIGTWLADAVPFFHTIASLAREMYPWDFFPSAFLALLLAVTLAEVLNRILSKEHVNRCIIRSYCCEVLRMLDDAMLDVRPVTVTLDSREVCVGFVQRTRIPIMGPHTASVRILRLGGGYRDVSTLVSNISYPVPEGEVSARELLVAIPLAAIKNVTLATV